ncbi:MAG: hypothetical protein ACO1SV_19765 [Fimbriimonas sp.]
MKAKKLLLIGIPLLALGCAAAGLIMTGIVKVPFLAKKKEKLVPAKPDGKAAATPKPKPKATPPRPTPPTVAVRQTPAPTSDPAKGVKKVAKLWNEIEIPKLQALTADWNELELARILAQMDTGKVAELLAALPPKRASDLTRAIQREASRLPIPATKS